MIELLCTDYNKKATSIHYYFGNAVLVFAWARPDYITARYNVSHRDNIAREEQNDFMRLSTDAAPALEGMADSAIKERLLSWYAGRYEVWDDGEPMGLRTCNFSVLKARSYLKSH